MDYDYEETPEQQIKIRKALNESMRVNAEAETKFQNAWRDRLEKKLKIK
jgi:hypothetical protein